MMADARFLLKESTEGAKKLRITFKLRQNGMRKQLPHYKLAAAKVELHSRRAPTVT